MKASTGLAVRSEGQSENGETTGLVGHTATIARAFLSHNQIQTADIPALIDNIHRALLDLADSGRGSRSLAPAVPIKKSLTDSHIICLEDGKKLKMLTRYLTIHFDLSPQAYRAKWNLPADYPMVAPAYARVRSAFAKKSGLGRIPRAARKRA